MELRHTFTVPASVEDTWAHFMDLEAVGGCFPGATITGVTGDEFAGTVKVKLGPIALLYAGTGRFVERDAATHVARIEAMGKDKRGNGTAGAKVVLTLTPTGEGTACEVVTDLAVTGKPAQFGRGVMQDVSDKLLAAFVECLEVQLAGQHPSDGGQVDDRDEPEEPSTPSNPGVVGEVGPADPPKVQAGTGDTGGPPVDDALDLGAAVLPVLVRTYGPYLLAGLVGLLAGLVMRRRSRH
jgi:carbon monoxide dehydrogenase subunit G